MTTLEKQEERSLLLRGPNDIVSMSEIGGNILGWEVGGDFPTPVFFPKQDIVIDGKSKTRGGMHVCFPNFGPVDEKFGLPQHGTIRNRKADEYSDHGFIFRGSDLLGSYNAPCEVRVWVQMHQDGFTYFLQATLLGKPKAPVFINPGFHPYFRTPEKEATFAAGLEDAVISSEKYGEKFHDARGLKEIFIPGLGIVKMREVIMSAKHETNVLWRDCDSYLCVEPVAGEPPLFGTPAGILLEERKSFVMYCSFELE